MAGRLAEQGQLSVQVIPFGLVGLASQVAPAVQLLDLVTPLLYPAGVTIASAGSQPVKK